MGKENFWDEMKEGGGEKPKVLVEFVLDRSGSMSIVRDETIRSFNKYVKELKEDKCTDYVLSMSVFNHGYKRLFEKKPINDVPDLTQEAYDPDGMTALNDAVGKTINLIGTVPTDIKVMVAVLTDGHENASREFVDNTSIQKLIAEKSALPNWTFVFLGTEADAWDVGVAMGINPSNIATADYKTKKGTSNLWNNMRGATAYYSMSDPDTYTQTGAFKGLSNMSVSVSEDFWDTDNSSINPSPNANNVKINYVPNDPDDDPFTSKKKDSFDSWAQK